MGHEHEQRGGGLLTTEDNLATSVHPGLTPANGPVHSRAQGAAMANIKLGLLVSSSDDRPAVDILHYNIDSVINTQRRCLELTRLEYTPSTLRFG